MQFLLSQCLNKCAYANTIKVLTMFSLLAWCQMTCAGTDQNKENSSTKDKVLETLKTWQQKLPSNMPWSRTDAQKLFIKDPFIELHTGPGRAYPVSAVALNGEIIKVSKRKTSWYQIETEKKQSGWVSEKQLKKTLTLQNQAPKLATHTLDDFTNRSWQVTFARGDFNGLSLNTLGLEHYFTPNISVNINRGRALGQFFSADISTLQINHQMFPHWRVSPFLSLGSGQITYQTKNTLAQTDESKLDNSALNSAIGLQGFIYNRFVVRSEFKRHISFTEDNQNEESDEWTVGIGVFF